MYMPIHCIWHLADPSKMALIYLIHRIFVTIVYCEITKYNYSSLDEVKPFIMRPRVWVHGFKRPLVQFWNVYLCNSWYLQLIDDDKYLLWTLILFSFIYWTQYCVNFSSGARLFFRITSPTARQLQRSAHEAYPPLKILSVSASSDNPAGCINGKYV